MTRAEERRLRERLAFAVWCGQPVPSSVTIDCRRVAVVVAEPRRT